MTLRKMQINHAFRHFTPEEMMNYFCYNEEYLDSLPVGTPYSKSFMTDGEFVYFVFFDELDNVMDKLRIAKLKYIAAYEIDSKLSSFN